MAGTRGHFLVLSAVGFYLLWVLMLQNGTLDGLQAVCKSGIFPTGRKLQLVYTGVGPVDRSITILVAFTDPLTNGVDLGARLLMIDVVSTLQTAALWVTVESLRPAGRGTWALGIPALWGLIWNGVGAAVVIPIYCYLHLGRFSAKEYGIPTKHAKLLWITMIVASYLPAFFPLLPPYTNRSPETHQTIIALFQLTPLAVMVLQHVLAAVVPATADHGRSEDSYKSYLKAAYTLGAIFSGTAHLYCLATSILSTDPAVAFSRVYVPVPSSVHPQTTDVILEGAFLFLRYDWLIINASCIIWITQLWAPYMKSSAAKIGFFVLFALVTVIIGPGASGSLALRWREDKLAENEKRMTFPAEKNTI